MSNNISSFIPAQIPEHINSVDSLFTEFLETYYQYSQLRENAAGLILNHTDNLDIDNTLDKYVDKFYLSYGIAAPGQMAIDKRTFIKLLTNLYDAKGTEKSFKYLFRLLFNTNIDLYSPRDQMLRTSSGQWEQQSFITVYTSFGKLEVNIGTVAEIANTTGVYLIAIDKIEPAENSKTRIFFKKTQELKIVDGSVLSISVQGVLKYRANIEKSPAKIGIVVPGNNFQNGQIYKIKGSLSDTIFKVTSLTVTGGIKSAVILFHGIGSVKDQQSYVSSYKTTPPNNGSSVTTQETTPGVFTHTISLFDIIYGIVESITGQQIGITKNSYFAEDYVQLDYFGNTLFDQYFKNSTEPTTSNLLFDVNTSFDQYLLDRAKISLDYDYIAQTPGRYLTNSGHLSDEFIRLQDSKYFQIFSYVIRSNIDISRYKNTVLKMLHPAGTVAFASLQYDYYIDIRDKVGADGKYIFKVAVDEAYHVTDAISKLTIAPKTDLSTALDLVTKSFLAPKFDVNTITDAVIKTLSPTKTDSIVPVELVAKLINQVQKEYFLDINNYSHDYFSEPYNGLSTIIEDFSAVKS